MSEFYLKIHKYNGYLSKYRQTGTNQYQITITMEFEDAEPFQNDDYIFELVKIWFPGEFEKVPNGLGMVSEPIENVPMAEELEWL